MSKSILVFAPHQDDEVLMCAGVIKTATDHGAEVHICVLTNGEYCSDNSSEVRSRETIAAMARLGIAESNVHFLGYADTGMKKELSFLWNLWNDQENTLFPSRWGRTETWSPQGDYAMKKRGAHSPYTRSAFLKDFCDLIKDIMPEEIFTTASCDLHGDHAAAGLFAREAVRLVRNDHPAWQPMLYEYLVHTEDEFSWPNRSGGTFTCPDDIHELGLCWSKRECRALPVGFAADKYDLINSYTSQEPESYDNYLLSFAKDEEIFWKVSL